MFVDVDKKLTSLVAPPVGHGYGGKRKLKFKRENHHHSLIRPEAETPALAICQVVDTRPALSWKLKYCLKLIPLDRLYVGMDI